jgi:AraC-like DNA-binding protein
MAPAKPTDPASPRAMRTQMRLPAALAADQVLCHFLRDTRACTAATTLRVPASFYGTLTLTHAGHVVDGRTGRALPRVALGGLRGRPGELHFAPGTVATTVVLKPGIANRLVWPRALAADQVLDGQVLARLAVLDVSGHDGAIALVEALLAERDAAGGDRFAATLRALLWRMPAMSMADLGAHFGCTARNLQRLFLRELGVAPKLFCRLARVHGFFWQVHALSDDAKPRWADLAGACGFSDQAHLHRELRNLAGLTPLGFLRALRQGPAAHWALRVPADALAWCHRPSAA